MIENMANKSYGVNSFASFQVSAWNAEYSAMRAVARAPSGQVRPVEVMEKDGVFTANFTPSESGK